MLTPRIYKPNDEDILYHYCDANAFFAICTNKKMRFSDLFSMNDSMEMQWGYSIWEQVSSELSKQVEEELIIKMDRYLQSPGIGALPVASCYSLDGDVLSQWRAYADDGRGFAIGFSAKDIIKLPARPLKVLYDENEQIKELKNMILAIDSVEKSAEEKFSNDFRDFCFELAFDLAAFKNPAFKEEQEVRLVHLLNIEISNDSAKLLNPGGTAFGKEVKGVPIQFRMRDNAPIAFIEQDFTNDGKINPIKEVIIGPKNNVLPTTLLVFLETIGIGSVSIERSKASYR